MSARESIALISAVGLCGLLAGCASAGPQAGLDIAQERGARLAAQRCLTCHEPSGPALSIGAPPFAQLGRRFNPVTFERRVRDIAAGAHYEMPPATLTPEEASDLAAYITALTVGAAPCNPKLEADGCVR